MCPCKIHKDSSELWIMWSSVTERLIVESPSWRINPSQLTQTLQLPRVCIKRRIRQINPRYKRWCDAAEIICERSPSIKCTAEMLIDEGAESKQQSRGSFINAKQKAAAAPRICSSAESESVRSCCGTHVGMCPACVSVLHPQGSLVHFCFVLFFSRSFEFWKDELVLSSLSLHFLGVRDGLSFSGFGGETAGADMSETKAREYCCYVGNTNWLLSMDLHKQKRRKAQECLKCHNMACTWK